MYCTCHPGEQLNLCCHIVPQKYLTIIWSWNIVIRFNRTNKAMYFCHNNLCGAQQRAGALTSNVTTAPIMPWGDKAGKQCVNTHLSARHRLNYFSKSYNLDGGNDVPAARSERTAAFLMKKTTGWGRNRVKDRGTGGWGRGLQLSAASLLPGPPPPPTHHHGSQGGNYYGNIHQGALVNMKLVWVSKWNPSQSQVPQQVGGTVVREGK